jgi:5-methylcytosine-specific restriction endonuclease McrA
MKQCTKCKMISPRDNFVGDKNRPDGKYPICKDCRSRYYHANRDRVIRQAQEYRKRPGIHAQIQVWHKQYADRRFFYKRSANLKLRANGDSATYLELARLWKQQRGICPLTGRRLTRDNSQLDHVVPLVNGGRSTVSNLRWVHRDVNYAKRDLSDAAFIDLCRVVAARHPLT